MREKIIVGLLIVACVVLGVLSFKTYNHHKQLNQTQAQRQAADHKKAVKLERQRQAQTQAELDRLQAQCNTQLQAYNQQPATQQAKLPKPQCNLQPVQ